MYDDRERRTTNKVDESGRQPGDVHQAWQTLQHEIHHLRSLNRGRWVHAAAVVDQEGFRGAEGM